MISCRHNLDYSRKIREIVEMIRYKTSKRTGDAHIALCIQISEHRGLIKSKYDSLLEIYFGGDKCRNFGCFCQKAPKYISAEIYLPPLWPKFISAEHFIRRNISPVRYTIKMWIKEITIHFHNNEHQQALNTTSREIQKSHVHKHKTTYAQYKE